MQKKLTVIENELVPVYETSKGEKVVYGSELHEVLNIISPYREWYSRRFKDCDAVENVDFEAVEISTPSGQKKKQHIIKLGIAKEMAMLERNEKGKQVRRYFIEVEKRCNEVKNGMFVSFKEVAEVIPMIANDLHVNNISRLIMYKGLCEDYKVPTGFLPDYVQGGDREKKPVTILLKEIGADIKAAAFNKLLVECGILEERSRKSTSSKTGEKHYKSLTEKGLEYGENLINPHNSKETQPYYYVDSFKKLYDTVMSMEVA